MPIYEYACSSCGHELETLQRHSDTPLQTCPLCHEEKLQRMISTFGTHIKGYDQIKDASSQFQQRAKARAEHASPASATGCGHCHSAEAPACSNPGFAERLRRYETM